MENEKGFTLVEVLASLVIISIVLMSFMALFGSTNRLAVTNSEKLVAINLADAYLERVKARPQDYIANFPPSTATPSTSKPPLNYEINEKFYNVTIDVTQDPITELPLKLLNVKVTVQSARTNMHSTVEGYVNYNEEE